MTPKNTYIVGNWKSNKTLSEAHQWLDEYSQLHQRDPKLPSSNSHIIICPPSIFIPALHQVLQVTPLPIILGSQDLSGFAQGAYTGEVNALMLSTFVKYTLVGHSERRKYFHESDELLFQKVQQAQSAKITPIYCVQDENMPIPKGCTLVAYEPIWAIGTGKPDTPENADRVAGLIRAKNPAIEVIYGGSVTHENVASYLAMPNIFGVLPGGASLATSSFFRLIQNAIHV